MSVSVYQTFSGEDIVSRSQEWIELGERAEPVAPFCRPETWIPCLESLLVIGSFDHRGKAIRNRPEAVILEYRDGGKILGVLALYRLGNSLIALSENHIDYQDILAANEKIAEDLLHELFEYAFQRNLIVKLGQVALGSQLDRALSQERSDTRMSVHRRFFGSCIIGQFEFGSPDLEAFVQSIPRRVRRSYRRASRKIETDLEGYRFDVTQGESITKEQIATIGRLHSENQEEREGSAIFDNPQFTDFLERHGKTQEALVLSRLIFKEETIAFGLGYFCDETYYFYITGYERSLAGLGIGNWVMVQTYAHVIRHADLTRFTLDFLTGSEDYKLQWETTRYGVDRIVLIPTTIYRIPWRLGYSLIYGLKAAKNRIRGIGQSTE